MKPIRLALFASGSGSNAENIVQYFSKNDQVQVVIILSNKKDAFVHERAKKLGIPSITLQKEVFTQHDGVLSIMKEHQIDFIVLAGFLLLVPPSLVQAYKNRLLNIHPALLPRFGGKGMYGNRVHESVVAAGALESGITIHFVNENYDEGDVVFQAKCPVLPLDTPDDVAQKVHALEYKYFPEIIWRVIKVEFGL